MFLETPRLILRRFQDRDFDDVCAIATDSWRNWMIGNWQVRTEEDARAFFTWMKDREPRGYALVLKQTGRVAGDLSVYEHTTVEDDPSLAGLTGREMSFSVAAPYRRQGLTEEACRAVIETLFDDEGVDYIADGYFDFNTASKALHEKLGFSYFCTLQVTSPEGEPRTLICCILRREAWRHGHI